MSPTLKSTGGGFTLGPNLWVFPLEQTRHVGFAKSEHPRLTNVEIIFEEFQPLWSQSTNVTDGRKDDMRSQDRALHCSASRGKNYIKSTKEIFAHMCTSYASNRPTKSGFFISTENENSEAMQSRPETKTKVNWRTREWTRSVTVHKSRVDAVRHQLILSRQILFVNRPHVTCYDRVQRLVRSRRPS